MLPHVMIPLQRDSQALPKLFQIVFANCILELRLINLQGSLSILFKIVQAPKKLKFVLLERLLAK